MWCCGLTVGFALTVRGGGGYHNFLLRVENGEPARLFFFTGSFVFCISITVLHNEVKKHPDIGYEDAAPPAHPYPK